MLAGPIEGHLNKFYKFAADHEPHWVVCAGDYGIWVDPYLMDNKIKQYVAADFAGIYLRLMPQIKIPTLTIAGAHDDNKWLARRVATGNLDILDNVSYLAQGYKTTIGWDSPIRVTGFGKVYSEQTWKGEVSKKSHRHYTRAEVERACSSGPTDILVLYEHIDSPGIRNIIFATRPKLILAANRPRQKEYNEVQNIPIINLERGHTKIVEWDSFLQRISKQ
jgi:hypothetical protein